MNWPKGRGLYVLAGGFAVVGLVFGVIGATVSVQYFGKAGADIGKSMMSLGVALLVSGAAAVVVKQVEQVRADRSVWASLLKDVVEVDETVEVARRLIEAHKTAKTYSEQHANIVRAKLRLRQVWFDPLVSRASDRDAIQERLDAMIGWIDDLGSEYETRYLEAARQQRIDEAYLKKYEDLAINLDPAQIKELKAPLGIEVGDAYFQPTCSWAKLENFDRLTAFRSRKCFEHSDFFEAYIAVKPLFEKHAGLGSRPPGQEYKPPVI